MFNALILIFTFVFSAINSFAQAPVFTLADSIGTSGLGPNSMETIKRNRVTKAIVSRTTIKDGTKTSFPSFRALYYDGDGRMIREEMLSREGIACTTTTFEYDSSGRSKRSLMFGKDGTVYHDWSSSAGIGILKVLSKDSISTDTSRLIYDAKGRVSDYTYSRGSGGFSRRFYYRQRGKIERVDTFDKYGKKLESFNYVHKNGRKHLKLIVYKELRDAKEKILDAEYNPLGLCTKAKRYHNTTLLSSQKFNYNTDGTLASSHIAYPNKVEIIESYNYSKDH